MGSSAWRGKVGGAEKWPINSEDAGTLSDALPAASPK